MKEEKTRRLKQVATTLNIGIATIVDYLCTKGFKVESKPTTKITAEQFDMLAKEYAASMQDKLEAGEINLGKFGAVTSVKSAFKLKQVAKALNIKISTIVEILAQQGYSVASKSTSKISKEQLDVVAEVLAVTIDTTLLESNSPSCQKKLGESRKKPQKSSSRENGLSRFFSLIHAVTEGTYRRDTQSSPPNWPCFECEPVELSEELKARLEKEKNKGVILYTVLKSCIVTDETSLFKRFIDKKYIISSIITPRLFHVFVDEEDSSRSAFHQISFSIAA